MNIVEQRIASELRRIGYSSRLQVQGTKILFSPENTEQYILLLEEVATVCDVTLYYSIAEEVIIKAVGRHPEVAVPPRLVSRCFDWEKLKGVDLLVQNLN